jgi:DNA-binding NarL/FixJ family response regulator
VIRYSDVEGGSRSESDRIHGLTTQEIRILESLARGLSNKAISGQLGVSQATVKTHVHSILKKLRVRTRGRAAAVWRDHQHSATVRPTPWDLNRPEGSSV